MADFKTAYTKTAIIEGGYANDPDDHGGETWRGIARNVQPHWAGWIIIDQLKKDRKNFPGNLCKSADLQMAVLALYKKEYWDELNLNFIIDQKVANELYDTAVNMGTGRSALFFQRALNVFNSGAKLFPDLKLDGNIGPKTCAVFNNLKPQDKEYVWRLLNCLQGEKYITICENKPSQEKFIRSWVSRVFEAC